MKYKFNLGFVAIILLYAGSVLGLPQREIGLNHCVTALAQMPWSWKIYPVPRLEDLFKQTGLSFGNIIKAKDLPQFKKGRDDHPLSLDGILQAFKDGNISDERLSEENLQSQIGHLMAGNAGDEILIEGSLNTDLLIDLFNATKVFMAQAKMGQAKLSTEQNWKRHLSPPDVYDSSAAYKAARRKYESMPAEFKIFKIRGELPSITVVKDQEFLEFIYGERGYRIKFRAQIETDLEARIEFYTALEPLPMVLDHPFDFEIGVFNRTDKKVRFAHFNGPSTDPIIKDFLIFSESIKNYILESSSKTQ